jgi:hypothetical protein
MTGNEREDSIDDFSATYLCNKTKTITTVHISLAFSAAGEEIYQRFKSMFALVVRI